MVDYKNSGSENGLALADGLGKAAGYSHESSQETIETTVDKRYLESLKGFVGQSLMKLLGTTELDQRIIQNSVESIRERLKDPTADDLADYAKRVEDPEVLDKLLREDKRSYYAIVMKLKEKKPKAKIQGLLNEVVLTHYQDTDAVDAIYSSGNEMEIADSRRMYAQQMATRKEVQSMLSNILVPYMQEQRHVTNRLVSTVNGLEVAAKETKKEVMNTKEEIGKNIEEKTRELNKKSGIKLLIATGVLAFGIGATAYFGRDYLIDATTKFLETVDQYKTKMTAEVNTLKEVMNPQLTQKDLDDILQKATKEQRAGFERYLREKEAEEQSREFFRNQ